MAYVGQDASDEWNMIHKPGTVEKNAQPGNPNGPKIMGKLGSGGGGGGAAAAPAGGGGLTMDDVAKHATKEDAWVVINGEAIDVTKWIPIHPGGEAAIMAYMGKDASEEWNMIHKPGTVEKNEGANVVKKGKVSGAAVTAKAVEGPVDDTPPPPEGNGGIPGPIGALVFLAKNLIIQIVRTIAFTHNWVFKLDNNRNGTIRSACFLLLFTIGHSGGNFVDIMAGPHSVNGEGYMFDRFHWMPAFKIGGSSLIQFNGWARWEFSLVDIYLYLSLLLHVSVALKRSWDISMQYCVHTGKWNMMISGLTVLTFLIHHLWDLQFYELHGEWGKAKLRPPSPLPVSLKGMLEIPPRVFFEPPDDTNFAEVTVRDLYSREVDLFSEGGVVLFYTACVLVFVLHMCWGWKKLVPADAMQIPKDHVKCVTILGQMAAVAIGAMYLATVGCLHGWAWRPASRGLHELASGLREVRGNRCRMECGV